MDFKDIFAKREEFAVSLRKKKRMEHLKFKRNRNHQFYSNLNFDEFEKVKIEVQDLILEFNQNISQ